MPLVTPEGFKPAPASVDFALNIDTAAQTAVHIELSPDSDVDSLREKLDSLELVCIDFPSFADGRGFSLAKRLRNAGYKGHLRAVGHVISDQYRYALDCGFDDVEISDELAARQPESDWLSSRSPAQSYRDRLQGRRPAVKPAKPAPSEQYVSRDGIFEQKVTHVEHYTDGLFSFRITRSPNFRFRSGEFAMIGLPNAAKPVFRAYSLASPAWDDELEFYSIKVPNGPLTEHLQHISAGDTVLLKKKATGTLVLDALLPGKRLFLISTGTGIAPFASIIRDPETYEKYEQVVLTQTCRTAAELSYGVNLVDAAQDDPIIGQDVQQGRLKFATSLTRGPHALEGRITDLINNGTLVRSLSISEIDPLQDRAMICGSVDMLNDTRTILQDLGFEEGSNARPATYVVERAFVD